MKRSVWGVCHCALSPMGSAVFSKHHFPVVNKDGRVCRLSLHLVLSEFGIVYTFSETLLHLELRSVFLKSIGTPHLIHFCLFHNVLLYIRGLEL